MKKTSMPNLVKSPGSVKCYRSSSPRPVKSPSNSIKYNCPKICSWSRRSKTILEIRKKAAFLYMINNYTGTTNDTFQKSGEQDFFRHTLKSSASIYESSGSHVFRTTTGIQSGPDLFHELWFFITFKHLWSCRNIYSFRLFLEGKMGKEIPESSLLEVIKKFSANNFVLWDAEDNTSGPLNRGVIVDLSLLRIL